MVEPVLNPNFECVPVAFKLCSKDYYGFWEILVVIARGRDQTTISGSLNSSYLIYLYIERLCADY